MDSSAEMFIGGAWATKPTEGCDTNVSEAETYCWTVEVGAENGCEKGFAFGWSFEDSYGDVVLTGRERLEHMARGQWKTTTFDIFTKSGSSYTPSVGAGGEATITSAACI